MNAKIANFLGVLALLCWSMNVAVTRHISEAHIFGMPGLSFLTAGLLLIIFDRIRHNALPWQDNAKPWYWLFGGGAFIAYTLLYTSGLSFSATREVVLPLGLVNYFWPSLILLLIPFFFHQSVRWSILAIGLIFCLAGVGCSLLWGMSLVEVGQAIHAYWLAFAMMVAAAFLWAFYSNAVRKWGGAANGVGWFELASGLCFLALWLWDGGSLGFDAAMLGPFLVHAVVVNACAYMLWDCSMRWGDISLIGALANFLPLGSIIFGSWYFGDPTTPGLWIGGALVTLGAILCRRGLKTPEHID